MNNLINFDYDQINNNTSHYNYLISTINEFLDQIITNKIGLLDIGCGNGYLTKVISPKFNNTLAVDLSSEGINQVKKHQNEKLQFRNIDLDKLIEEEQKFDFITCFEVIEHQYLPDTFLNKINKLLNNNGYLLLSTPYHGYFKNLAISLLNKHDWHFNPLWRHGHIKFFSIKTFKKTLSDANFEVIKYSFSGRFYPFSCSMIFLCNHKI